MASPCGEQSGDDNRRKVKDLVPGLPVCVGGRLGRARMTLPRGVPPWAGETPSPASPPHTRQGPYGSLPSPQSRTVLTSVPVRQPQLGPHAGGEGRWREGCPERPVAPTAGQPPFSESSPHPEALGPGVPKPPTLVCAHTPPPPPDAPLGLAWGRSGGFVTCTPGGPSAGDGEMDGGPARHRDLTRREKDTSRGGWRERGCSSPRRGEAAGL